MRESIERLNTAIEALTKAAVDPVVQAEFGEGDERMLNVTIGALIEYRESLEESASV